jgi:hypothetical protein
LTKYDEKFLYHLNISGKLLFKVVSTPALAGGARVRRRDSTAAYSTTGY